MKSINIPEFYCPFTSVIHPQVELAQKHTIQWAKRFQFFQNEEQLETFLRLKSAYLVGRTFTETDLDKLKLTADWCSWLYLCDDQCDNVDFGKQPEKLKQLIDRLIAILYEDKWVNLKEGTPLEASLSDLWVRLKRLAPKGWKERYRKGVKDYLEALYWEANNRAENITPSVKEYMSMRGYSGAAHTVLDLTEITNDLTLSQEIFENETFQRMHYLANITANWSNDVISYEKEIYHNDVHNLVIAFQNERNLSLEDAVTAVVEVHDQDVTEFIQLEKELPSFGSEMDEQLKRYFITLRSWMRGHIDWIMLDTKRFESQV